MKDGDNFSSLTEKEREDMRRELSSYLNERRLDSEGKPLVILPSNFNQVVSAMNREDVFSSEEKPWSKYLLQSSVTAESLFGDKDSSTRYRDLATDQGPDGKIKKGLAEIYMLDRQLQDIAEKDRIVTKLNTDRTFLTKQLPDQEDDPDISSARSGKVLSARANEDQAPAMEHRNSSPKKVAEVKSRKFGLSAEEESRLQLLLDDDFIDETDVYTEFKQLNAVIDQQLERYGRVERLRTGEETDGALQRPEEDASSERTKRDYLAEQRQERQQKEALKKVDKLLRDCLNEVQNCPFISIHLTSSSIFPFLSRSTLFLSLFLESEL